MNAGLIAALAVAGGVAVTALAIWLAIREARARAAAEERGRQAEAGQEIARRQAEALADAPHGRDQLIDALRKKGIP